MDTVLEVLDLSVRFGRKEIIRKLSFEVERGRLLAVIGPNGAGKTVLLKALAGLLPSTGTIRWADGVRLGYVPQRLDLERDLPVTGLDYLGAMAAVAKRSFAEAEEALAEVRLPRAAGKELIGNLSGGQFQRMLLAGALLGRPNVLLLDEATSGIDEPGQEQIQETIHRLRKGQGMTVLLISHELRIVDRYADNVLCLSRAAAWCGPPAKMLTPEALGRLYGSEPGFHGHEHDAN